MCVAVNLTVFSKMKAATSAPILKKKIFKFNSAAADF